MSNLVDCVDGTTAAHVLIAAMTEKSQTTKTDIMTLFGQGYMVDVVFQVNGIDVPFTETVDELFERQLKRIDERVLEKAKELISASRFNSLSNKLSELEWQIEEEFEKIQEEFKC